MFVRIISDCESRASKLTSLIEIAHAVLPNDNSRLIEDVLVIDFDLGDVPSIQNLQRQLRAKSKVGRRVFVLRDRSRWLIAQACALGASTVTYRPIDQADLLAKIAGSVYEPLRKPKPEQSDDISEALLAFKALFGSVSSGIAFNTDVARHATCLIIQGVSRDGLKCWLDNVRRHHEGTYQHCLIVAGVAVEFALRLGFSSQDVQRVGFAATLHDIGKAAIPVAILDKPGRLDAGEEEIIRRHPRYGYDCLLGVNEIEADTLDAVLHHHEFLDGSGYPDKLRGSAIGDLVRLLTISDIFGALIENRSYRPAMPPSHAYKILLSMDGKLEIPLVKQFNLVSASLD